MVRIMILALSLISLNTQAGALLFENINEQQFKDMSKEFAANFVHTAVTPPQSLGDIWGVEVGVVFGATKSDATNKVVTSIDPDTKIEAIPHAGLMAQVSIPYGISFEGTMFPETETDDIKISTFSLAGKFTLTQELIKIPLVDIATRFHLSSSEASSKTTDDVSNVPVDSEVKFESSSWGINLSAGLNLFILKPYVGIGYVSTDTELSVESSTGTIFDSSFTSGKSASEKHSGAHYFIGTELDLLFLHLGVEYAKVMDITKVTGKFSFAI